ncbi:hypothetical protein EON65_50875 [archaeon]|nr:MAG: hypothetical protein EON65_50875 [archaeon]
MKNAVPPTADREFLNSVHFRRPSSLHFIEPIIGQLGQSGVSILLLPFIYLSRKDSGKKFRSNMADFKGIVISEEELQDGYSAEDIFTQSECIGITFDDLIALPGAIDFGVQDVDLTSKLTKNITLNTPLCSTPMDTVTEHEMAIGMALNGSVGFIHCNCTIEEQVAMVSKVKQYENGFILDPAVLPPTATVRDLDTLRKARKISGVPVTVDGKMGSKLVGLISHRDTDFLDDRSIPIGDLMTPLDRLVTGTYPLSIAEANKILKVIAGW